MTNPYGHLPLPQTSYDNLGGAAALGSQEGSEEGRPGVSQEPGDEMHLAG